MWIVDSLLQPKLILIHLETSCYKNQNHYVKNLWRNDDTFVMENKLGSV